MQADVDLIEGFDLAIPKTQTDAGQSAGTTSRSPQEVAGKVSAPDLSGDQETAGSATAALAPFVHQRTVPLTTFRRNGMPVGTPVNIAVVGERAFVRTWEAAGKFKRIRANPEVVVTPSTVRGHPTGPGLWAQALILDGPESAVAGRALAGKHPLLHGVLVPLVHRLRGNATVHLELRPVLTSEPFPLATGNVAACLAGE